MKKIMIILLLTALACLSGIAAGQNSDAAQTPEPTQTPYIIYVVVTATPEPQQAVTEEPGEDIVIKHPAESGQTDPITIVNTGTGTDSTGSGGEITIANQTGPAGSVDDLVRMVVATVTAQNQTTAGGGNTNIVQQQYSNPHPDAVVNLSDGSTCTMNFQLISEPTYPAGAIVPRGEVFWKEWLIQNTGTCTWTPDWEFVFDSGWQIGNTRFHMNRTTAPGETLTVRLGMVPDQQDGNYYSTYIFEAPDGTQNGTITSSYTVKPASYFAKPTPETPKPKDKPRCYPWCPWRFPWCWYW